MNASAQIQIGGFSVQLASDGEVITFVSDPSDATTNVSLRALVNRNIVKGRDFMRLLKDFAADFEVLGLTEIELRKVAAPLGLSTAPEAGQYFLDQSGYRHRVRYVTQTDITWLAYCTPSPVT